ncbi:MAG: phospholipase, partial [Burkholderiaceae bacterium]|nr:phospholipase [Burkholderiaceae bacterium]
MKLAAVSTFVADVPAVPGIVRRFARGVLLAACSLCAAPAFAWSNHALATAPALEAMPEFAGLAPVKVESLESFLAAQGASLEKVLDEQERWAREHVIAYPPRPEALRFVAADAADAAELRRRFVAAVRISPEMPLSLFLQRKPGAPVDDGRAPLPAREATTLPRDTAIEAVKFAALREGEQVAPIDVVASASDEPDYGLDLGLWEDNGTAQGRAYGFGKQPFGNPALDFGTQAPFHMGFYHESRIVYAAAGFLKRTYPEYRVHLWKTLALHALRTGHDYWGWRFAGWAMH